MNDPSGFTLDDAGNVVDVDPLAVIFNDAMPLHALHMIVAAYVVGGFMVASVYAVGLLRGRRDRYHRLGFGIAFSVAAVATPIQMGVGDSLARWVYNNQPTKFAAIELVPDTSSDVPETLLGRLNADGTVSGGIRIPGLASWLSDPSTGTATVIEGLDEVPASERPTDAQVNVVHLAWDVMVGLGTLLFLVSLYYGANWAIRRRLPDGRWFLRVASACGVLSVITMEAGWVVTEVGRQPWIVYGHMKVEDAATGNTGVWITFVGVVCLYVALAVTTVLVLRGMSRRYRADAEFHDRRLAVRSAGAGESASDEHRRRRRPAPRGRRLLDLRGRRLRCRHLGPARRRRRPRRAPAVGDRTRHRTGLGGQPRLADLHLRRPVDVVPDGIRVDHAHAVRAPRSGGVRHRAARGRASRSARRSSGRGSAAPSEPGSRSGRSLVPFCFGAIAGAIATGRVPAGGEAGDPVDSWINPTSLLGGVLAVVVVAYLAAVYLIFDARRLGDDEMVDYFRRRARRRGRRRAWWRRRASSSSATTLTTSTTA